MINISPLNRMPNMTARAYCNFHNIEYPPRYRFYFADTKEVFHQSELFGTFFHDTNVFLFSDGTKIIGYSYNGEITDVSNLY